MLLTIFHLTLFVSLFRDIEEGDVALVKRGRGRPPKAKVIKRYAICILLCGLLSHVLAL